MKLEGKVAIVTGASRGIGRAVALRLAREGCDVAVNYRASRESAQQTVDEIMGMGRKAMAVKAHVANAGEVEDMVNKTTREFGKIDILANNAGIEAGEPCPFTQLSEEDWNTMYDINVKGVFLCSKAAIPYMISRKSGRIINTASVCGKTASLYLTAYSGTKAAVIALTQGMALELGPHNITVNAVCPGGVDTDMTDYEFLVLERHLGRTADEIRKGFESSVPLGHRIAKPEEIAGAVAFLASDDASYITGVTINVSGGVDLH
jgi:3-oxoacyl-[acyl-carrier protein] reductase